ncbi:MAG: acyl-ACP--UDP-N-acetylglucosamine O-acyltransferase [Deltaproteobacteria bacterium]|nr:acyl-ACP--UDP-N-acetylglucosamine O-acyltransferase [Deltaproteobacteria bacterium]
MDIHPAAFIHPEAELGEGVKVGPGAVINAGVVIGSGTEIMAHAYIESGTTLGRDCVVFPSASLGTDPQDITYTGEPTALVIGDEVIFREFTTVSRGTGHGGGVTRVGNKCYFMANSHVGHDCQIGNNVIMVNSAARAGHCIIEDWATVNGLVAVVQRVRIGTHAFIGAMSKVVKDVPPYLLAQGVDEFKLYGPNVIGLKRKQFSRESIKALREAFRLIFRTTRLLEETLKEAEERFPDQPEVKTMISFIRSSKTGVPR